MHLPDGFLAPYLTLPAYGLAVPLWIVGARRHFGSDQVEALPAIGSLTALAFVIQSIMIPVPGGTSTHLLGMPLLAIVFGPLAAFVCESLVLALQAVFFGAGGLTVLSVNALAMGLIGPTAAWLTYRALRCLGERRAAFAAAYLGMQVATLAIALVLGLQHRLSQRYFPVPFSVSSTAMLLPSATLGGVIEGLYTVTTLMLLRKAKIGATARSS